MKINEAQLYELIVELQRRGLHVYNPDQSRLVAADEDCVFDGRCHCRPDLPTYHYTAEAVARDD